MLLRCLDNHVKHNIYKHNTLKHIHKISVNKSSRYVHTTTRNNMNGSYTNSVLDISRLSTDDINTRYKPYKIKNDSNGSNDWTKNLVVTIINNENTDQSKINTLILYGSLRERSKSKLLAYELARILDNNFNNNINVHVYSGIDLPVKSDTSDSSYAAQELSMLVQWCDSIILVSPEQHGSVSGVMKNIIDYIQLGQSTDSKVCAVASANGAAQSYNTVNTLRILGRWLHMYVIPNQVVVSNVTHAFDKNDRLHNTALQHRCIDLCEQLYNTAVILKQHKSLLSDRYSTRNKPSGKKW